MCWCANAVTAATAAAVTALYLTDYYYELHDALPLVRKTHTHTPIWFMYAKCEKEIYGDEQQDGERER